jgi:hypothetical protein
MRTGRGRRGRWRRRRRRWRRRGRWRRRWRRWRWRRRGRWRGRRRGCRMRDRSGGGGTARSCRGARRQDTRRRRSGARSGSNDRPALRRHPAVDRRRRAGDSRQRRHVPSLGGRERQGARRGNRSRSESPEPEIEREDRARRERGEENPEREAETHRSYHRSPGGCDGRTCRGKGGRSSKRGSSRPPPRRGSTALERHERALGAVERLVKRRREHVEGALVEGLAAGRTRRHPRCLPSVPDGPVSSGPARARRNSSRPPSPRRALCLRT